MSNGTNQSSPRNREFSQLSERFLEDLLRLHPVSATALGDHRYDDLLDEAGVEARERQRESARECLEELSGIDRDRMSRDEQVDAALLEQRLQKILWELDELREWEWNPLFYTNLPGSSLYLLLSRDFAPISERLAHVAARCRQFPRFFARARESLAPSRVPMIHAETAVEQNLGILQLLDHLVVPALGELPSDQKKEVADAVGVARKAIEEQQEWLEETLLPAAGGNPRLSETLYRRKFDFDLFSSLSPEDLRARAEAEKKELHERMYELSCQIEEARNTGWSAPVNPSPREKKELIQRCLDYACEDHPDPDQVLSAACDSLAMTTDFIREKDLVTLPDAPLEIIPMPEFQRGVSVAYCDAPGPLEKNGKTFYAVSPPPRNWTPEQVTSFLREYNFRSLHNLTVHEAMPGHYVQLLRSNETASRLRSVLASGTFIEGWAVYTESMMMEEGFLPGDLLMRLVVMKWNLRGVTNALLDQMIHLDGIEEETAMDLMVNDAFQEEREAAGKYRRSLLTSVQLSTYFAGYIEVAEIREEAERRSGSFDIKSFHDELMSFGSPPPAFVKALLFDQPLP